MKALPMTRSWNGTRRLLSLVRGPKARPNVQIDLPGYTYTNGVRSLHTVHLQVRYFGDNMRPKRDYRSHGAQRVKPLPQHTWERIRA